MAKWTEMHARERDLLVAEKIFGVQSTRDSLIITLKEGGSIKIPKEQLLPYTTSMDAAWGLVERFRGRYDVHVGSAPSQYDVAIMDRQAGGGHFTASAASAAEAICLAALKAVGYEIEE